MFKFFYSFIIVKLRAINYNVLKNKLLSFISIFFITHFVKFLNTKRSIF